MKQSIICPKTLQSKKFTNLKFCKIKKKHLPLIRDWRNSQNIFPFNSQYYFLNMIHQTKWFESIMRESDKIMFMINLNDEPVGICGLIHYDSSNKSADVAIILGQQSLHGIGLGTIVLQKLVHYGFVNMKLHRIGAEIFEYNTISKKLFTKLNFKHEVTYRKSLWRNKQWWDILGYGLSCEDYVN